ncbi:MAG TPA: isochorismatase family protein, partial [Chloroflexota bacterium]|nr:isochorismatase family protein [Chloroflexota bacterium]
MATESKSIFKSDGKNEIHDGIEHAPGGGKALLDPTDTVLLLLDHQSGLFQSVKDISVAQLRANTTALAKLATLHQIPVITTASVPDGPNGPLMPEIHEAAPHAVYVPRKGEVNAWDNALFAKTVRETGKKTLVIGGVWTSVCVMFP